MRPVTACTKRLGIRIANLRLKGYLQGGAAEANGREAIIRIPPSLIREVPSKVLEGLVLRSTER